MKKIIFIFLAGLFLLLAIAAVLAGYFINQSFFISPDDEQLENFVVEEGESVGQIAANLKDQGIIESAAIFKAYAKWTKIDTRFKTGIFELQPGESMMELASELTSADVGVEKITLIEGWTVRDIGFAFENKGMFQAEEIFEQAGLPAVDYHGVDMENPAEKWKSEFDFLASKPEAVSLDGFLFPDTYYFYRDATAEDAVRRMLENFDEQLKPEWRQEIERQGKTVFDVITMASIIEREMHGLEARKMVSDIFWKRLEIGMALQADSTVNYVTGKKTPAISGADAQVDSPWNTYKYPGLPLGPICNPSAEAIEAAIYPTANDYYYFLTTPDGEIIYSKTHEEHVENKQKYLR